VLALGLFGAAAAEPFDDGQMAYDQGHYADATQLWLVSAESGDARSELMIGLSYAMGRGVPQDDAMAIAWYRRAADHGSREAAANLGTMYARGRGVPLDYAQAILWWQKSIG
jgi:hypothetical protein